MSYWTHITSCMSVDTFIHSNNILTEVRDYIAHAPVITGSEQDAEVFVNLKAGHNFWTSRDCDGCKYKQVLESLDGDTDACRTTKGHECRPGEYQSCVVITVQGDLRDRMKSQTQKEFDAFKKYIEKEYMIRDYSLNIESDD